ncbi:MAG: hypothetical protein H0W08_24355 [Acidobacteria bacterium]|nr:hypothetical protein [Acidobacteriota bacterium]
MQTHVKVVAVLLIVFSALGVLVALGAMAMFGGAAGIVGAAAEGDDAALALPIIGLTGTIVTIFLLALSVPGLLAGYGLLNLKPWGRILGIVLCAINLINIPFGTVFGIYGLWVLLNNESERLFLSSVQPLP